MKRKFLPLLLSLLVLMIRPDPAQAENREAVSRQEAANIALGIYPGRVLAVKRLQTGGSATYRVKTLGKQGDVHIIIIDAASGRVVSSR